MWGSTYLAIRVGVETMPPLLMAAARQLVAGLIMFPLAMRSRPRRSGPLRSNVWPSRAEWLGCAIVGILLLVANGVVGVGRDRAVRAGRAARGHRAAVAARHRRRPQPCPDRPGAAGLLLGLAGVALLSGLGGDSHGTSVTGVLIILGAAAAWALGTIMAGRVTIPSSAALASGMELLAGGAALLVLSATTGEFSSVHLSAVSARSWLALGYLIVFGSIVAFSAYGIAVRDLPTATVATYAYVNPVIAVLLGALILNERLTPATIAGGVLIVGAVFLVVRRRPPAH